jgi:hypothetical protein
LDFMCGIFIRVRLLLYAQSSKKCVWFDYLIFKSFSICFSFSKKLLFCTVLVYVLYYTRQGAKMRTSFECKLVFSVHQCQIWQLFYGSFFSFFTHPSRLIFFLIYSEFYILLLCFGIMNEG